MWHPFFSAELFQCCFSFLILLLSHLPFPSVSTSPSLPNTTSEYPWSSLLGHFCDLWGNVCVWCSYVCAGWPGGWLGDAYILRDKWQARRYIFSAGHLVAASWQLGKSNSTWCFSAADGPNKWFFKLQETHSPPVMQACYKGWTFQQGKEVRSWKQSCQKPGRQRVVFFF